jgi:formylglycine-generating enzyme required for sulfatase activity/serine/threonine protein kinase
MIHENSNGGTGEQPQVFISYGRADAEQVLEIARLLEAEGATVWRDGDRILGGQYYGEEIVHAIAHSRVVMLMCSPHSFQSDNVHREVLLTWEYAHRRYVPVWLSPATDIPQRFRYCLAGCQWIDAHSQPQNQWLPQLLKAFKALGVDTKNRSAQPGQATPGPIVETDPRTVRFRPGDRPIRGADWELERLLAKGGFGEVWKAHNPDLPGLAPVALKFCLQLDDRSKALLRHEANVVLRAQRQIRSDGIVPLLHAYLNNDPPCLEYPYIEGGTLVRLIDECRESTGLLKLNQAQRVVQRVAQIVTPAHRATPKLVHRDLKPSNILVERGEDGKIVLRVTDFGIGGVAAQPVLERSRSTSSLAENMASVLTGSYSPLYASPQQMRGDKPDPRDDVYALGVIWYQLLTGDLTSPAPTGRRWVDDLRKRGMGDAAVDLLSSCFESAPAHRPDDAGILFERLRALTTSNSPKSDRSTTELQVIDMAAAPAPNRPHAASREGEAVSKPNAASVQTELLPAGEPSRKPARTEPRPPKITEPSFITAAPEAEHAKPTGFTRRIAIGMLGLVGLLGVILYIATDHGTIKITGTDPTMKVTVDGKEILIENLGKPITIRTGPHKLLVTRDGLEVKTDNFLIRRGDEKVLEVTYTLKVPVAVSRPVPLPAADAKALRKAESPAPASPDPEYITANTCQIKFKRIPAGSFLMGSPDEDKAAEDDEKPQHGVRITKPFYLGVHEVTRGQFRRFVDDAGYQTEAEKDGKGGYGRNEEKKNFEQNPRYTWQNPGFEQTDDHPVVNVSWNDAQAFVAWLSQKEGRTYRLPTEAEWEYACRAGSTTRYSFEDDPEGLAAVGNVADGTLNEKYPGKTIAARDGFVFTAPVGRYTPNVWGLFDMHGNVYEWCSDGFAADYYKRSPVDDPRGVDGTAHRVIRGGSWLNGALRVRAAYRDHYGPSDRHTYLGFRCARVQSGR